MSEYSTYADIDGERCPVAVDYELDGCEALVYGIFSELDDEDLTLVISEEEYDRICEEVNRHIVETMIDAAELMNDMGR